MEFPIIIDHDPTICLLSFTRELKPLNFVAIVGDITPSDGIPKAEKSRREQEALNEMCKILGDGLRGID